MKPALKDVLLAGAITAALLVAPMTGDAAIHHRSHPTHHRGKGKTHNACGAAEPHVTSDQSAIDRALAANPPGPPALRPAIEVFRDESGRDQWYIAQATSYTCGPSVMAMAIADHVLHSTPTLALVRKLTKETGTDPCDGMPDWWIAMPPVLQKHGLQTKNYVFNVGDATAMDALDAELAQGHSAIVHVNNPRTHSGNGHFLYVAGKTKDGRYVIGNPDEPANDALNHDQPITRQQLEDMMVKPPHSHPKYYKGVPGFVAVW